jgi:hypothetical protein
LDLESRLKTYREKTARIAVLELEIQGLEEEIKHSTGIHETDMETIEGMALRRALDGVGGKGNESKVERVALKYKDEQGELCRPKNISHLYEQIRDKQGELKRLQDETLPVEKALKGITDKQRLIVTEYYINGNNWYRVGMIHQDTFGYYIGKYACQKVRDEALKKMRRILGA